MATSAKDWKQNTKKVYELVVPSGNTCLVRRPGPEIFAQQGLIPNSLLGIVMPLLDDAKEKGKTEGGSPLPDEALAGLQSEILKDPQKLTDMMAMTDSVTVACVVAPEVTPVEVRVQILNDESLTEAEKREKLENLLFVDEVDFEDKMFIFQYAVGGSADLERFREGTQALVAVGQDGPEVQY